MKSSILDDTCTDKSVCWRCKYEHDDKNECIDFCGRLKAYQQGQPYSHIPHYEKVEPALSEGVSEVEMEQKESDTIPAPIDEEEVEITLEVRQIKKTKKCLICGREESDKVKLRRGLCLRCYQRWNKDLILHPIYGKFKKMSKPELNEARGFVFDQCLIFGCDKLGDRRGLCQHDYRKWQRGYITHPELGAFFPKGKRTKAKKIVAEKTLKHGISDEALRNVGPSLDAAVKRIEDRYNPQELHTVKEILDEEAARVIAIDFNNYPELYEMLLKLNGCSRLPLGHTLVNLISIGLQSCESAKKGGKQCNTT